MTVLDCQVVKSDSLEMCVVMGIKSPQNFPLDSSEILLRVLNLEMIAAFNWPLSISSSLGSEVPFVNI